MGRTGRAPGLAGARTVVTAVRLTPQEAQMLDAKRGLLSRSEYLRWMLRRADMVPKIPDFK